ncbi:hypothetical protein GF377_01605, partial [candidate division GN15 bacterium]|nr:hypothetical protein [candidate division GN15 bacterium]
MKSLITNTLTLMALLYLASVGSAAELKLAENHPDIATAVRSGVPFSVDNGACGNDGWHRNFARAGQITAQTLEMVNGVLYVGGYAVQRNDQGNFITIYGVYTWDGETWTYPTWDKGLGPSVGSKNIRALEVVGTDVYVGGEFNGTLGGNIDGIRNVARWDGETWHQLDGGVNNDVYALSYDGAWLYVGGDFTTGTSDDSEVLTRIARWDGFSWEPLLDGPGPAQGTNFSVNDIIFADGGVIVGGGFSTAGGEIAENLAKWNPTTGDWTEWGGGTDFSVSNMAAYGGEVYIAGSFTEVNGMAARQIARWDGSQWHNIDIGGQFASVNDVVVTSNGDVYICGTFNEGPEGATRVARWNGTAWEKVFGECNIENTLATDLATDGETVAVTGGTLSCYAVTGNFVITGEDRWIGLGDGIYDGGSWVWDVLVNGDDVWVGGIYQAAGSVQRKWSIARWDDVDQDWYPLGDGDTLHGVRSSPSFVGTVFDQEVYEGNLYAGGTFSLAGSHSVKNIAYWDGADWSGLGGDGAGVTAFFEVQALEEYQGELYIGGNFNSAIRADQTQLSVNGLVRWDGTDF